jgi:hypothetical protein
LRARSIVYLLIMIHKHMTYIKKIVLTVQTGDTEYFEIIDSGDIAKEAIGMIEVIEQEEKSN